MLPDTIVISSTGSKSVIKDSGLTDRYIFANTPALKTVVLPQELAQIGLSCFENSGVSEMELPLTIHTIADYAFKNCDGLKKATLSPDLLVLGDEAFYDCDSLEQADLPSGLETLGSLAFAYCEKLQNAYIPAGINDMRGNPFAGCTGITNLVLDKDNTSFTMADGVLYDKTMYAVLYYPASLTAETFQFPGTVQEIAIGAFAGAKIKSMTLPTAITSIPDHGFAASALESIVFHPGVKSVGDHAFDGCQALNNVNILSSMGSLGDYAFANCTSLNTFTFEDMPDGLDPYVIGTHFFDGCTAMTEMILPNRLTLTQDEIDTWTFIDNDENPACIPGYMFANTGLVNVVIPAKFTDPITPGVFYGCKQLQSVVFEATTLKGRALGQQMFAYCTSLKEIYVPSGLSSPFSISGGIVYVNATFEGCTALEKVTINTSGESLIAGYATFKNCTSLTTIEVLKSGAAADTYGFSNIYEECFAGCTSLKEVPIYSKTGTAELADSAFAGSGIEKLTFYKTTITFLGGSPFRNMPNLKELFIYCNSTSNGYKNMDADTFANIGGQVNVYFFGHTKEEVLAKVGNDAWLTNADEGVTFYFKDTIPEGVEVPSIGSGSGGGGSIIGPGIRPLL